jgi:hypothetical protein
MSLQQLNAEATEKIYRPLQNEDIRLVTIYPAKFHDEPIHISLEHVQVSAGTSYEALSYVWGSTSYPQAIWLDGTRFHITQSLYQALRYLRPQETKRVLWIDALAINQSNENEKNVQVQNMHMIYRSARQTIVWLGAGHDEESISRAFPSVSGPLLKDLPYWRRLWIVQEVVLSKKVVFQYGSTELDSHKIRQSWRLMLGLSFLNGPLEILTLRDKPQRRRFVDFRGWAQHLCPQLSCQDPRDKVFGFLHLLPPEISYQIEIDYGKSVAEVYTDATWRFINHDRVLQCIDLGDAWKVSPLASVPGLPTWVPNYNMPIVEELKYEPMWEVAYVTPSHYHALLLDDTTTLWLKGICIGSCVIAQNSKDKMSSRSVSSPETLRLFWDSVRLFGEENVASDAFIFAFGGPGTSEEQHLQKLRSLISSLPKREEDASLIQLDLELRTLLGVQQFHWIHSNYELLQFTSPLDLRPQDPESSLPANSGFGIGFWNVQAQDELWMIAGCKNPIILRRIGNRHKFIGNSYIPELAINWIHLETLKALEQLPLEDIYLQ